jgi:serine/threonine protein kinase
MSSTRDEIHQLINSTGKYKLLEENTEGANAFAFRAHHVPLDLPVFLKVLDADLNGDLYAEPRFLVEATLVDGGESNLVRVHDAQRLGKEYVLVAMEFVEGGSILSRLNFGPFPMMEAVGAAIGILHGLGQLHSSLLVHRDIKPANVLLTQRYGRIWPKISDFGSVARLAEIGSCVTASRHSALYVPPEGWATPSRYDVRSDLYQVGLVLFEMVHGPLPYDGESYLDRGAKREIRSLGAQTLQGLNAFDRCQVVEHALARASEGKGVTSFRPLQPFVSASLARVINKAVAANPASRYQTPSEMIGDLEALMLPKWKASPCGGQFHAQAWSGWNWCVEKDPRQPEQWVVLRSRQQASSFRRWATAPSPRAACRLVSDVAT